MICDRQFSYLTELLAFDEKRRKKTTLRSAGVYVYTSAVTFTFYLNEISIDSASPKKINQLETQSKIDTTNLNAPMAMSSNESIPVQ